jgi:hypothetical protein
MRQPGSESQSPASAEQGTGVQLRGGRISKAEWAVFDCETNRLLCRRCGCSEAFTFPVGLRGLNQQVRRFVDDHRWCAEPKGDRS